MAWLAQLREFILQFFDEQYTQYAKDIVLRMATSVQRGWQEVQFQYYNTPWNTVDYYYQLGTMWTNKGMLNVYKIFDKLYLSVCHILKINCYHKFYILFSIKKRNNVLLNRHSNWNCDRLLYWCQLETSFSSHTSHKSYSLSSLLWYRGISYTYICISSYKF